MAACRGDEHLGNICYLRTIKMDRLQIPLNVPVAGTLCMAMRLYEK